MDSLYKQVTIALNKGSNPEKPVFLQKFFKTEPGQYGEGDLFIGLSVPQQRTISKIFYAQASLDDIKKMLHDPIHEFRLTALFMLVLKFEKTKDEKLRKDIFDFYLNNTAYINNWDLVDSSAEKIPGAYLFDKNRTLLLRLAESESLWEQRISIIATFYFIKKHQFEDTLAIAEKLLYYKHDLIHKAVGWMLREVGNRDFQKEYDFLSLHYQTMPRTMLRYAIEKFEPELRKKFLEGSV
ncbi:MAG: DNA alkylation repair protein [Bacteroidetes bacterium]|nr:DNA alkylation repair protein [Bacteroidota bacterium]HET6244533.1 DNA alkylation repair protein [Bacteroidia bacterium]